MMCLHDVLGGAVHKHDTLLQNLQEIINRYGIKSEIQTISHRYIHLYSTRKDLCLTVQRIKAKETYNHLGLYFLSVSECIHRLLLFVPKVRYL